MKQYKNNYRGVEEDYLWIVIPLFFYIGMVIILALNYLYFNL